MEMTWDIVQQLGIPVALIAYYLFIERPRQERQRDAETARHDSLVDKIIAAQTDCSNKMNQALSEHTRAINELTDLIDKKIA